jgi:hypothetical protein
MEMAVGSGRVVMFFLTSSCFGCRAIWEGFQTRSVAALGAPEVPPSATGPARTTVIVVTPSPSTESAPQVGRLAPGGGAVLMASEVWHAYGVTAAPWYVVVDDGLVAAEGPAPSAWGRVETLIRPGP